MEKEKNILDQILDENNNDNIILYNENGEEVEFEQIAIIPLNDEIYLILKPVIAYEGMSEEEGLVFLIEEYENDTKFHLCTDDDIIVKVFEIYFSLCSDNEN